MTPYQAQMQRIKKVEVEPGIEKCPNQGAKKHQGKQPHGRGLAAEELNRREQSDNPGDEKIPTPPQGNQFKTADGKKEPRYKKYHTHQQAPRA